MNAYAQESALPRSFPGAESRVTSAALFAAAGLGLLLALLAGSGLGSLTFVALLLAMAASTAMRAEDKAREAAELDRWIDTRL